MDTFSFINTLWMTTSIWNSLTFLCWTNYVDFDTTKHSKLDLYCKNRFHFFLIWKKKKKSVNWQCYEKSRKSSHTVDAYVGPYRPWMKLEDEIVYCDTSNAAFGTPIFCAFQNVNLSVWRVQKKISWHRIWCHEISFQLISIKLVISILKDISYWCNALFAEIDGRKWTLSTALVYQIYDNS